MPRINDYKCTSCGYIDCDRIEKPDSCPSCSGSMEVTFENWSKIEFDARKDERTDAKGFVKKFSALDDPLCAAQLGMGDSRLQSYNKLSEEESTEFRQRLIAEGDSPKLRRQILAKYNEKVGNKYELQD